MTFKSTPLSTNGDAEFNWWETGIVEVDVANEFDDAELITPNSAPASPPDTNSMLAKYSSSTIFEICQGKEITFVKPAIREYF